MIIKGTLDKTEKGIKVISNEIVRLDSVEASRGHKIEINLKVPFSDSFDLRALRTVIGSSDKGGFPLYLRVFSRDAETLIATGFTVSYDKETVSRIEKVTGKGAVVFQ